MRRFRRRHRPAQTGTDRGDGGADDDDDDDDATMRRVFGERRSQQAADQVRLQRAVVEEQLRQWYQRRLFGGFADIDYGHQCSIEACADWIQPIGPTELRLYGCLRSGLYHVCALGADCAIQPASPGYRRACRNNVEEFGREGSEHCVFSRCFARRVFEFDFSVRASSRQALHNGDYDWGGNSDRDGDSGMDSAADNLVNPFALDASPPASPVRTHERPAAAPPESPTIVALAAGLKQRRLLSSQSSSPQSLSPPPERRSPEHTPVTSLTASAEGLSGTKRVTPDTPDMGTSRAALSQSAPAPAPAPASTGASGTQTLAEAAAGARDLRTGRYSEQLVKHHRDRERQLAEIRQLVERLCCNRKLHDEMCERMRRDRQQLLREAVMDYLRQCRMFTRRPSLPVLLSLCRRAQRNLAPVPAQPIDDETMGRVCGIVYRAWDVVLRVLQRRTDSRTTNFRTFTLGVLYMMQTEFSISDQMASVSAGAANASASSVLAAVQSPPLLAAGAARPLLTMGSPAAVAQQRRRQDAYARAIVARTDGDAGALQRHPGAEGRVALGSASTELSRFSKEHVVLPRIDVLAEALPPRNYLEMFASRKNSFTAAAITQGMRCFKDAMAAIDIPPDECARYIRQAE
jgi:hypothetical protein